MDLNHHLVERADYVAAAGELSSQNTKIVSIKLT